MTGSGRPPGDGAAPSGGGSLHQLEPVLHAGALALLLGVAAFLRLDRLGVPSFWLDEILGQVLTWRATAKPWWQWLLGLEPEHGPLYYATQMASRFVGSDEAAARAIPALIGTATVLVVWIAARAIDDRFPAAMVSAALIAVSPLHVYYSREARPYAVLIGLTAVLLVLMLRRGHHGGIAAMMIAILYTSAVGAPILAAAAVTAFASATVAHDRSERRHDGITGTMSLIALALVPLLYRGGDVARMSTFPDVDGRFFGDLLRSFTVSALGEDVRGRTAVALLLFGIVGTIALSLRSRRGAIVVVSMTLLPVLFSLLALRLLDHWYAPRYVSAAIVGFLLLAGTGVVAVSEFVMRPLRSRRVAAFLAGVVTVALTATIVRQTWPAARRDAFQKLDWRGIASLLQQHVRSFDAVVTAEGWSQISLDHYFDPPRGVRLAQARTIPIAAGLLHQPRGSWLVTSGFNPEPSVRYWMCGYPLLLASPHESFRLHYGPSARHFLLNRATRADLRALSAAVADAFTLHMNGEEEPFLNPGWGSSEGAGRDAYRWVIGDNASIVVPQPWRGSAVIHLRVMPLDGGSLPPQTLSALVNEKEVARVTLKPGWNDYAFDAGKRYWREGLNTLAFRFSRATAPATLGSCCDERLLAAAFDTISVEPPDRARATHDAFHPALAIRAAADGSLLAAARGAGNFSPEKLRRDSVEILLGRLGYDPVAVWPKVRRGELRIEQVVASVAYGSDCESDPVFLRRTFATLLNREPNGIETSDLLQRMRSGSSREAIVARIAKVEDFRAWLLQP